MATNYISINLFLQIFLLLVSTLHFPSEARRLTESTQTQQPILFEYHNGPLLTGKISINLIWYGNFKPSQRAIVSDFVTSLSSNPSNNQPSVATWWKTTDKYYQMPNSKNKASYLSLSAGKQILDENYSLGKSLTQNQVVELASKGDQMNAVNVVLTASDVTVDGFCSSRCGTHGSSKATQIKGKNYKFAYIWVGNSETQCPGQCAWPFHQPIYGPQSPPLVAPNNDVGLDGMVTNLASLLAGTATNPFGNGYYQGPASAPLEAASACPGVYGNGAYPGYAGDLLVDPTTGASYNAHDNVIDEAASACPGVYGNGAYPGYAGDLLVDPTTGASYNAHGDNGRKYLLPALYDPATSSCSTLIFLLLVSTLHFPSEARRLTESTQTQQPILFEYHNGPLLTGKISINLIWYGNFKPSQRAIVSDFVTSLSSNPSNNQPSVATWWKTTDKYYQIPNSKNKAPFLSISAGKQILDENYSLGKSLTQKQIVELASKGDQMNAVNVVLTASDVIVDGFCSSRCGTHGSSKATQVKGKNYKFAYIWVGNSETQCPGQCAWPFHQPIYGPQSPPLVAPNN
ncbi:hypothetical protein TEA_009882 [Camellia sinensis var. sinensis]|uniref:Phosphate-induced protein 1 n=1 Tax=Camellia sinensis var. sinensis TaxID=542762 RepID=A0A4S4D208_CAMSN|nr:hypothetical protein TEA_009882 [Camellia sinensis var. sinensis]